MLNKLIQILFAAVISLSLIFTPVAQASEFMEQGAVLQEDSIVFTLEEADKLRIRMESLELTEQRAESLGQLVGVQEKEIATLEELLTIKDYQIDEWEQLSQVHQNRVEQLERQQKFNRLENVGWFVLGIAVTGGAIYLGDKIGDSMETN
jgi:hypothetical protein